MEDYHMMLDSMEDLAKGPFCKPYGQLFYENLEKMPSFQVIEAYLSCLLEAQDRIQRAISILEGILKKGSDKLRDVKEPMVLQYMFGKSTSSRGAIEKEIEHHAQNRRNIDDLIAKYSESGVLDMPITTFMTPFDSEYQVKVEKKQSDSDELYYTEIKGSDLRGSSDFDHLNKVMTGYLIKKLMRKSEQLNE
jgi:hypothetical protein